MAEPAGFRVVLFTSESARGSALFRYLAAQVMSRYPDTRVVSVRPAPVSPGVRFRRGVAKLRRIGALAAFEVLTGAPLQRRYGDADERRVADLLDRLPRPTVTIAPDQVEIVRTINGPDAVACLEVIAPHVLIQAGAGLLRTSVFSIPTLATLNLHHGIAPLIRGMNSIYWGLWEQRPEWLGSTVHLIDAGIDTGRPLGYAPVAQDHPGEGYPELFVRATAGGVAVLLDVLRRLQAGDPIDCPVAQGPSVYRSTFPGWRHWALRRRLAREARSASAR